MSTDPIKQAWQDVAESVTALGRMLKAEYRARDEPGTGPAEAAGDATSGDATPGDATPGDAGSRADAESEARLRAAIDRLLEAGRDVGDSVSEVAHDPEITSQAKRTAASLEDALTATVNMIADEVSGLFRRGDHDPGAPGRSDSSTWDPPTSEPRA